MIIIEAIIASMYSIIVSDWCHVIYTNTNETILYVIHNMIYAYIYQLETYGFSSTIGVVTFGTFAVQGRIFLPLNFNSHEPHFPSSQP